MSIFEYDEETHMRQEREENRELGREEGRAEGEWMTLISQVQKKLAKGLKATAIADMLEQPEKFIEELIKLIEENPGKTEQELAKLYKEK